MDPESKKLLQDTFNLAQENNELLRSMKRSMRLARVMSILYWVFIIGSAVGAYYLIQPYVDQVMNVYSGAGDAIKSFKSIGQ